MKKNIKYLFNYFFPHTCVFCLETKNCLDRDLCEECRKELPLKKPGCKICLADIANKNNIALLAKLCGNCIKNPPLFDQLFAPYSYQNPIDYLITKLKFNKKLIFANLLGKLMVEYLAAIYKNRQKPQIIIPIPLHKKRLRERGFNQALEISKPISKNLQIKIDRFSCQRVKNTVMQSLLPAKEREQNIKNAFAVTNQFKFTHVAVIDDVFTTGNTIREFCKTLKKSGVQKIDVWCVARG